MSWSVTAAAPATAAYGVVCLIRTNSRSRKNIGKNGFARNSCRRSKSVDLAQRDRLGDDLRGVLEGELLLDELSRALYATDASLFRVVPAAVIRPRHEPDVRAVVRYASEHQIPLTARGAGTGTAGACLGPGVVLDFSRFMHDIVEVGAEHVRVQPGVPWERLAARLERDGRRLVAEPASATTSTLGGMVAVNSSGPRMVLHGSTREHVLACRVVLDNGDAADLGRLPRQLPDDAPDRLRAVHRASISLLERHAETIGAERLPVPSDRCGYRLHETLGDESLDYLRLLAGSEGTLGLITELTL